MCARCFEQAYDIVDKAIAGVDLKMAICSAAAKNAGLTRVQYLSGDVEDVAEVMTVMGGRPLISRS